ncbi:hypothetical protein PROFUN_03526, partial [Planoprotostelium fungivorum]
ENTRLLDEDSWSEREKKAIWYRRERSKSLKRFVSSLDELKNLCSTESRVGPDTFSQIWK